MNKQRSQQRNGNYKNENFRTEGHNNQNSLAWLNSRVQMTRRKKSMNLKTEQQKVMNPKNREKKNTASEAQKQG